jgi:hypothetical protein
MAVKAPLIQSLLREHFKALEVPDTAWRWDVRNATLSMIVDAKPRDITMHAGKMTLRDLSFHLGRIQGWWEAGSVKARAFE